MAVVVHLAEKKFFFLIFDLFILTNNKLNTTKKWQKKEKPHTHTQKTKQKNKPKIHTHREANKALINWEESSRLKANSEVNTYKEGCIRSKNLKIWLTELKG